MANKTKNELLVDIDNLNKALNDKEAELMKYEQVAACKNNAEYYKSIYDSYVEAGFTEEQSLEILKIIVERTINNFMSEATRTRRVSYYNYR